MVYGQFGMFREGTIGHGRREAFAGVRLRAFSQAATHNLPKLRNGSRETVSHLALAFGEV